MKYLFFIFFILPNITVIAQKVVKIEIHSIPMLIETNYDVPCSNKFDKNFYNYLVIKEVTEADTLTKMKKLLLMFKPLQMNTIDVRGQIIIFYQNETKKKICFDKFGDFYDSGKYLVNEQLFEFLKLNKFIEY